MNNKKIKDKIELLSEIKNKINSVINEYSGYFVSYGKYDKVYISKNGIKVNFKINLYEKIEGLKQKIKDEDEDEDKINGINPSGIVIDESDIFYKALDNYLGYIAIKRINNRHTNRCNICNKFCKNNFIICDKCKKDICNLLYAKNIINIYNNGNTKKIIIDVYNYCGFLRSYEFENFIVLRNKIKLSKMGELYNE